MKKETYEKAQSLMMQINVAERDLASLTNQLNEAQKLQFVNEENDAMREDDLEDYSHAEITIKEYRERTGSFYQATFTITARQLKAALIGHLIGAINHQKNIIETTKQEFDALKD